MNESIIKKREQICNKCPLRTPKNVCNPKLWLNPQTDEVSTSSKAGYIRGCGCVLTIKIGNPNTHCNAGKW